MKKTLALSLLLLSLSATVPALAAPAPTRAQVLKTAQMTGYLIRLAKKCHYPAAVQKKLNKEILPGVKQGAVQAKVSADDFDMAVRMGEFNTDHNYPKTPPAAVCDGRLKALKAVFHLH